MDKKFKYNILLGRPWIHLMQAIPSTLHKCMKFLLEGMMIIIKAKDDTKIIIRRIYTTFFPFNEVEDTKSQKKKKEEPKINEMEIRIYYFKEKEILANMKDIGRPQKPHKE